MKLLWCSNAPFTGSGYGVQSSLFAPRLRDLGHDVAFYANWGIQGSCIDWNGMRVYPADGEWGNRTMVACSQHHGDGDPCQIIVLADAWVMDPSRWSKEQIAIWAPVDHWPLPPPTRNVLKNPCVTPIAMSRFGQQMMADSGFADPLYVPHGVDTDLFRPMPEERASVRSELNLPADAFVVGMVAANQGAPTMHRKAFPQQFKAFAKFKESHKDAVLYVHTNEWPGGNGQSGLHLRKLAETCGLTRKDVFFTEVFAWELGLSREALAQMYSGFDVFLNCAMGEGFGVPIVEAQACGLPVIVTDHSAMTELCGSGWLVGGEDWYDGPQDAWLKSPSVAEIVFALEQAYQSAGVQKLSDDARAFGLQYDVDRVMEDHWEPVLDALCAPVTAPERVAA